MRARLRRRRPRRRPRCGLWPRLRQPRPGKGPPTRTAPPLRCRHRCRCRVLLRGWWRRLKPRSAPLVAPQHPAHAHSRPRSAARDLSPRALRGHPAIPAAQATRGPRSSAGSACLRWALSFCSACRDLVVVLVPYYGANATENITSFVMGQALRNITLLTSKVRTLGPCRPCAACGPGVLWRLPNHHQKAHAYLNRPEKNKRRIASH